MDKRSNELQLGQERPREVPRAGLLRRSLYSLSWALIWPVLVLVLLLVVMGVVAGGVAPAVVGTEFERIVESDGLFYFELFLFIMATILVMVLHGVKWLLQTRSQLFFKTGASVLGTYIWMGIFLTGLIMVAVTQNPEAIRPLSVQDKSIAELITEVGGNTDTLEDVSLAFVDGYEEKDRAGEYTLYTDSSGAFSYATLTVKKGLTVEDEKIVVAHEYLHHIWATQLDQQTQRDLTSQLMTLYGKDEWMQRRVASYSDTNMLIPTELFSFYCTESSDRHLTKYLIEQCNRYIDRGSLRLYR